MDNIDGVGFGLGLSIVADVVKRCTGPLALEDRPSDELRVRVNVLLAAST